MTQRTELRLHEIEIEEVIEQVGGGNAILSALNKGEELRDSLLAAYPTLKQSHANQWIVWSEAGVVATAETTEELFQRVTDDQISLSNAMVEYIDADERLIQL